MNAQTLANYLTSQLGLDADEFSNATELFSEGLLDSFSILDLVKFIEEHGGIEVSPSEVTLENLDSIDNILGFVNSKAST